MKKIIINEYNLRAQDLDYEVIRVKWLIVNSQNQILMEFNNNTYQFPGGHLNENEKLEEALLREIREETGITIKELDGPFMQIVTYDKNYFGTGKKVCSSIFYYRVLCDDIPDFEKTDLDELERLSEFGLRYVNLRELESFLKGCLENGNIDKNIMREMSLVLDEYNNLYGGLK